MKPIKSSLFLLAAAALFALSAIAAPETAPASSPQNETVIQALRSQRDQVTAAMQDAQLQLAIYAQEIGKLNAKVAELQKTIDDAKPKKTEPAPAAKTDAPAAPKPVPPK